MDQPKSSPLNLAYNASTPAYLAIGSHEAALEAVIELMQSVLCVHKGCRVCTSCRNIQIQQHHSVSWFYPDKNYTLEQFESLHEQVAFELDQNQHHFFVIQKAEALTPACTNALLKSLEEPPQGYHYILMTHRPDALLPTLRSRCIECVIQSPHTLFDHPIAPYFTTHSQDIVGFTQAIEKNTPTEQESGELLDTLFKHWCTQYQSAVVDKNKTAHDSSYKKMQVFLQATQKLPMAGSSKLFWKNLYLSTFNNR